MKPNANTTLIEGDLCTFWFEENGILCALAKNRPRSLENQKKNFQLISEITKNEKVCMLFDISLAQVQDKETREYAAIEMQNIIKAMAVLSDSHSGRFAASIFITLSDQPVPIKMFDDEKVATSWLKQYL